LAERALVLSAKTAPAPLGELLLRAGRLDEPRLEAALALARRWDVPLGAALVAKGWITSRELAATLADQANLPFIDIRRLPPDPALLVDADLDWYVENHLIPWRRVDGHTVWVSPELGKAERALCRRWPDERAICIGTGRLDLLWALQDRFRATLTDRAVNELRNRDPGSSASTVLTTGQLVALWCLATLVLIGLWLAPAATLIGLNCIVLGLFLASFAFKIVIATMGAVLPRIGDVVSDAEVAALADEDLPTYAILVPMFQEPEVLPILASALRRLDYPLAKLDVKIVLEEHDDRTIEAAKQLRLEGIFDIVVVPASQPQTKPKACNYALWLTDATYVVIFDAEDQPESDQLKRAVLGFRKSPANTACLQARLNYYNADENWLTRLFTIDYSLWFDLMLPALDYLKLPIPLGGTSNHFRTDVLRELHAWDPFNVTEDADLGIRLAQKGYRVGVINSTTFEEANCRVGNWIRQRSRWLKGYMQTWLVHMRNPVQLWRMTGARGFLALQLFIGGTVAAAIVNPILWAVFLVWLATQTSLVGELFPPALAYASLLALVLGNLAFIYLSAIAPLKRRRFGLVPWGLTVFGYWVLTSIAGYKALGQLMRNPFYWEKTQHGISTHTRDELQRARETAADPLPDPGQAAGPAA
jgi:cellulose synthase/poly-beta-1,6-N-acetylglucosamine synthase-like glycosyltransferase